MKKRILAVMTVAALSLTMITGCRPAAEKTTEKEAETTAETAGADAETPAAADTKSDEQKLVGITVPSVGNDFMLALSEAMKNAVEEAGCKVQLDSAENNVTTQIEQIENYASMGCDIIAVWAVNGEGVSSACEQAKNQGIDVLAFAYEIKGASSSVISATEESMAAQCVAIADEWINETFADAGDGEVKVLVVTSSTTPESVIRSDGLKAIADNAKVSIITAEVGDQDKSDEARTLAENTFQTNEDIDVVLCMNGTIALGFESFLDSSSSPLTDKSKFGIFCVDETDEIIAKINESATDESVLRGTVSMGSFADTIGDFMKAMTPLINDEEPVNITGSAKPITAKTLAEE